MIAARGDPPQVVTVLGAGGEDLDTPRSVWIDPESREIHVADMSADRVRIYDWGGRDVETWPVRRPVGGAITPEGMLILEEEGRQAGFYDDRGDRTATLEIEGQPWESAEEVQDPRYSQVAVDRRGRIYLCDCVNRIVVVATRAGRYVRHFGRAPGEEEGTAFESASAFCLWGDRRIVILDGHASRAYVYSLDGDFLFRFGEPGGTPGQLAMPVGVAVDSHNRLLVLDKSRHCISVYDERGAYTGEYGGRGHDPGWLYFPDAILAGPEDRVFVTEGTEKRVQVLLLPVRAAEIATFERAIGEYDAATRLNQPTSFEWNEARREVLVADTGNNRVSAFERDGRFLWSIASGLTEPVAAVQGPSRDVYVAEMASDELKVFDPRGRLSRTIPLAAASRGEPARPGRMRFDDQGTLFLIDRANAQVVILNEDGEVRGRFGSRGDGDADFQMPQDLFIDGDGQVWIVDSQARVSVKVFSRAGRFVRGFGRHGDVPEAMGCPSGICVDAQSRVWIADQFRQTVQVYDGEGRFLFCWGEAGAEPGRLNGPAGISIASDGGVMVLEKANGRISLFRVRTEGP